MKTDLPKREFLKKSTKVAIGTSVGLVGLGALNGVIAADEFPWPWSWTKIDPEEARLEAHEIYWKGKGCSAGVFGGIVNLLAKKVGEPWKYIPIETFQYGHGGGVGWGTLCGALNGASGLISMLYDRAVADKLISDIYGFYIAEKLPTDKANEIGSGSGYRVNKVPGALTQNIAGSILCHASVSTWCNLANKKVGDTERKERCGRLTGDIAALTVKILNDYADGNYKNTFKPSQSVEACLTCHGSNARYNVYTYMECNTCHPNPHAQGVIENLSPNADAFKLHQNTPNPFRDNTTIKFSIPRAEKVELLVYDMKGDVYKTLIDYELYQPGEYSVSFSAIDDQGTKLPGGIYFCRITAGSFMQVVKMLVVD